MKRMVIAVTFCVLVVAAAGTVTVSAKQTNASPSHNPHEDFTHILNTLFGGTAQSLGNTLLGYSLRVINQSNDINNSAILIFQKVISDL